MSPVRERVGPPAGAVGSFDDFDFTPQRSVLRRRIVRRTAVGASLMVVTFAVVWSQIGRPHPNPDPGGVRLAALKPIVAALPAHAAIINGGAGEPMWDSCDGRAGTFGWDDVAAIYQFTTGQPPTTMVAHAARVLRHLGWSVTDVTGLGLTGSRVVEPGVRATVSLDATTATLNGPIESWDLDAYVPAAGPRAHGC